MLSPYPFMSLPRGQVAEVLTVLSASRWVAQTHLEHGIAGHSCRHELVPRGSLLRLLDEGRKALWEH